MVHIGVVHGENTESVREEVPLRVLVLLQVPVQALRIKSVTRSGKEDAIGILKV